MRVYERRPSGLAPAELAAHARREPSAAAFTAVRVLAGIVGIGLLGVPGGPLLALVGVALLASGFLFVRDAGRAAIERPSLVMTGTPKWDGVRRTSWAVLADEPLEAARALAAVLDDELGDSLTAFDEGERYRGATRREVLDAAAPHPGLIAWGVGRRAQLAADGDTSGVWLRVEPPVSSGATSQVTVLADEGAAARSLSQAAWRA